MNPKQQVAVWNNVMIRCADTARVAGEEGAKDTQVAFLQFATFAGFIAAAYNDLREVKSR